MKGVQLTVSTVIIIILGLVILITFAIILSTSKGQVDIITARESLRSCCGDRSIYKCDSSTLTTLCKVPWKSESMTLEELRIIANVTIDNLNSFCFC